MWGFVYLRTIHNCLFYGQCLLANATLRYVNHPQRQRTQRFSIPKSKKQVEGEELWKMVGIGGLFGVAEAYRTTYGSFVYWLGYRALIPKKVRSIRPRVTNVCRSPVLRPVKRAAAITQVEQAYLLFVLQRQGIVQMYIHLPYICLCSSAGQSVRFIPERSLVQAQPQAPLNKNLTF